MAKYELPIYGKNDEITKTYTTNIVSWGVFIQAADLQDKMNDLTVREQMQEIGNILKAVFEGLTDSELERADVTDVMNTFIQINSGGQKIKGGNGKNV